MKIRIIRKHLFLGLLLALAGCNEPATSSDAGPMPDVDAGPVVVDSGAPTDAGEGGLVVPEDYLFTSRFNAGESSVAHSGQTARHVLIADLKAFIGGLDTSVAGGSLDPSGDGTVVALLDYFYHGAPTFDPADRSDDPIRLSGFTADQPTYGDLSASAHLIEKLAGNDTSTDYRDWSTEFVGWSDTAIAAHGGGVDSPTNLMLAFFETLEANAQNRATADDRLSPAGERLPVHVTESGLDLQQLVEKFLLGAVAFHQAADDYMDDDDADKGLLSSNDAASGTSPYTALEHAWDEAFGYFGASAYYAVWTAASLAAGPNYMDVDSSGGIDLFTEMNFGASVNAAKRDEGAAVATDFMGTAWTAFRTGRALIASGPLDDTEAAALRGHRDAAIGAWERAIAATVVHYINDVLEIMDDFETADYDHARFLEHAKAWSEMKGFALMFQFNPRSPLTAANFEQVHTHMGDAPVLPGDATAATAYRTALTSARTLLGEAYGFDAANLTAW